MSLLGRLFGKRDREFNSGIPVEVPGAKKPLTMQEMIQRYIREEVARDLGHKSGEVDTWDESDDFEEEDPDTLPMTHHQVIAMDDSELREEAQAYGIDLVDDDYRGSPGEVAPNTVLPGAGPSGGPEGEKPS